MINTYIIHKGFGFSIMAIHPNHPQQNSSTKFRRPFELSLHHVNCEPSLQHLLCIFLSQLNHLRDPVDELVLQMNFGQWKTTR